MSLRIPKHYGDCLPGGFNTQRPCPYTCKHKLPFGNCSLDAASVGPMSIEEIAVEMQMTPKAVEHVLARALKKLSKSNVLREFYER